MGDTHVGTEIAGYRIGRVIARGGMGVVYEAHQTFPDRRVALRSYLGTSPPILRSGNGS